MSAIITEKFRKHNATQFYESFSEAVAATNAANTRSVGNALVGLIGDPDWMPFGSPGRSWDEVDEFAPVTSVYVLAVPSPSGSYDTPASITLKFSRVIVS